MQCCLLLDISSDMSLDDTFISVAFCLRRYLYSVAWEENSHSVGCIKNIDNHLKESNATNNY